MMKYGGMVILELGGRREKREVYMKIEGAVSEPKELVVEHRNPRSRYRRKNEVVLTWALEGRDPILMVLDLRKVWRKDWSEVLDYVDAFKMGGKELVLV